MNLCPVLKETGRSVTSDDPSYLFPDDSVDVITAFVQFVYEGFFVVTSSVTVEQVLDFMSRIGLVLTEESFQVFIVNIIKLLYYFTSSCYSDHTIQDTRNSYS